MLKKKSQQDTGSGQSGAGAGVDSTAARSKASRKSASKPISRGPGLSDTDVINIVMNGLNSMQDRFGSFHFVTPPGDDEPALLVLPKTLYVCLKCGVIILAADGKYCKQHRPKPDPMLAPVVKNTAYVGHRNDLVPMFEDNVPTNAAPVE